MKETNKKGGAEQRDHAPFYEVGQKLLSKNNVLDFIIGYSESASGQVTMHDRDAKTIKMQGTRSVLTAPETAEDYI